MEPTGTPSDLAFADATSEGTASRDFSRSPLRPAPLRLPRKDQPSDNLSSSDQTSQDIIRPSPIFAQAESRRHQSSRDPLEHATPPPRVTAAKLATLVSKFEVLDAVGNLDLRPRRAMQPPPCGSPLAGDVPSVRSRSISKTPSRNASGASSRSHLNTNIEAISNRSSPRYLVSLHADQSDGQVSEASLQSIRAVAAPSSNPVKDSSVPEDGSEECQGVLKGAAGLAQRKPALDLKEGWNQGNVAKRRKLFEKNFSLEAIPQEPQSPPQPPQQTAGEPRRSLETEHLTNSNAQIPKVHDVEAGSRSEPAKHLDAARPCIQPGDFAEATPERRLVPKHAASVADLRMSFEEPSRLSGKGTRVSPASTRPGIVTPTRASQISEETKANSSYSRAPETAPLGEGTRVQRSILVGQSTSARRGCGPTLSVDIEISPSGRGSFQQVATVRRGNGRLACKKSMLQSQESSPWKGGIDRMSMEDSATTPEDPATPKRPNRRLSFPHSSPVHPLLRSDRRPMVPIQESAAGVDVQTDRSPMYETGDSNPYIPASHSRHYEAVSSTHRTASSRPPVPPSFAPLTQKGEKELPSKRSVPSMPSSRTMPSLPHTYDDSRSSPEHSAQKTEKQRADRNEDGKVFGSPLRSGKGKKRESPLKDRIGIFESLSQSASSIASQGSGRAKSFDSRLANKWKQVDGVDERKGTGKLGSWRSGRGVRLWRRISASWEKDKGRAASSPEGGSNEDQSAPQQAVIVTSKDKSGPDFNRPGRKRRSKAGASAFTKNIICAPDESTTTASSESTDRPNPDSTTALLDAVKETEATTRYTDRTAGGHLLPPRRSLPVISKFTPGRDPKGNTGKCSKKSVDRSQQSYLPASPSSANLGVFDLKSRKAFRARAAPPLITPEEGQGTNRMRNRKPSWPSFRSRRRVFNGGSEDNVSNQRESSNGEVVVANAQCGLQEPKPVRLSELRRLVSLCKEKGKI